MRLAFAVSTMIRPDILIMDEWLSVGDESFKDKAENRMTDLVNNAQLLIIASHSKDLLYKICNRIIWLEHGKIKWMGSLMMFCRNISTKNWQLMPQQYFEKSINNIMF